jgi:protein-S-isoprenylcysteine O-methyltransferase Ste14
LNLHGEPERAMAPRLFLAALHLAALILAGWLLVGGGLETAAGWESTIWPQAVPVRRWLLLACAAVYFLRVNVTAFHLLKRKMGWGEATLVGVWVLGIHSLFAYFGGTNPREVGPAAAGALALYVAGSYLNTASEWQRKSWKDRPENKGRLYTVGLFRYAMHINYFGDELLFTGYALLTGVAWMLIVPALMLAGFVFFNIPDLDKHLREHYGAAFEDYARRTFKFVPYVY